MQDSCKLLNGIIKRIKETDFSHNELIELSKDLKNIKNNLNQTSKKFIDNIVEYASQFKDIRRDNGRKFTKQ